MYALVDIKGKQYKAEEGKTFRVDKFSDAAENLEIANVLLLSDGEKSIVGNPYVEGANIQISVVEEIKDKKIRVFKYKKRKKYRKTQGHRQKYTVIKVEKIVGSL